MSIKIKEAISILVLLGIVAVMQYCAFQVCPVEDTGRTISAPITSR